MTSASEMQAAFQSCFGQAQLRQADSLFTATPKTLKTFQQTGTLQRVIRTSLPPPGGRVISTSVFFTEVH